MPIGLGVHVPCDLSRAPKEVAEPQQRNGVCLCCCDLTLTETDLSLGETTKEHCLRAYSHDLLSLLSYKTQNHSRKDSASGELGHPTSITNQQNSLWACLQASLMEEFSQLRFPLLRRLQLV